MSEKKVFKLDFGKHEGKTLSEIPRSYVEWLVNDVEDEQRVIIEEFLARNPKKPSLNFGKHKGVPLSEVPRRYLRWVMKQEWFEDPDGAVALELEMQPPPGPPLDLTKDDDPVRPPKAERD